MRTWITAAVVLAACYLMGYRSGECYGFPTNLPAAFCPTERVEVNGVWIEYNSCECTKVCTETVCGIFCRTGYGYRADLLWEPEE